MQDKSCELLIIWKKDVTLRFDQKTEVKRQN
jgi:hypothetical protein